MYSYLSLLLFILFVSSSATPFSLIGPRRSILREVSNNYKSDHSDYAIELNSTNFDYVLKDTPATYVVVEFFAHWCPASRNYKPHYEKVARLFNGPDAVHPGIILMTRVDCALKINNKLCDKFSVGHYPMLFWGHPSKFVGGSWEPKQEISDLCVIDDARTADMLLNWINEKFGSSFGLDDSKFENGQAIYDVEEATITAFDIILEHKMIQPETCASLIQFLQLLVAHHPSRRCRKGSAELLASFADLYPTDFWSNNEKEADKGSVRNLKICGKVVPRGYWIFCRGSKNDTRGFGCGLWVLLHSLSVRIEDGESQFAFNATCGFVQKFFICEECRQHFYKMCSSAHNNVNERLSKDVTSLGIGDPNFPKTIWPPKQLCPSCYLGHDHGNNNIQWNQDEAKMFLTTFNKARYYALSLWSTNNKVKDKEEASLGTGGLNFLKSICPSCYLGHDHRNKNIQWNLDEVKKFLTTFNKARDYALSLWSTHNKVNDKEEASLGIGGPVFPKTIWPLKKLCPSCYLGHDHKNNKIQWNLDEVKKFLTTFNKARDYALSLWSTHNKVNDKEETFLGTGGLNFLKSIWPPKQPCPSCSLGHDHRNNKIEWNQDEVYKFLTTYYGKTITSLYKDEIVENNGTDVAVEDLIVEASNAVVVPSGAALVMAFASCAFGALVCYWRLHQKSSRTSKTKKKE